jgi:nitroreductase
MSIRSVLLRLTPRPLLLRYRDLKGMLQLVPNFWYDLKRYHHHSGLNRSKRLQGEQAARITMAYHQLEKGMSLAEPRPGFGKDALERLLGQLRPFVAQHGLVSPADNAVAALNSYIAFNEGHGLDMSSLRATVDAICHGQPPARIEACNEGGTHAVTRETIHQAKHIDFPAFFNTRYSIRNYSGGEIPAEDIQQAVRLSQKTPSVCNRQAWKVHVYTETDKMKELLDIQKGNRGFGHLASAILLVTCDLNRFVSAGERYQAWIDGGMFCMSLCLSLHHLGYGTCCLNWSKERQDDVALHKAAAIRDNEQVIMLISVGTLPEAFKVAYSPRRPMEDVIEFHR